MTSTTLQRPKWLSVKEVALCLDMHEQSVRRKIRAGQLPALQLGGPGCALRVMEDDLRSWLAQHRNTDLSPETDGGSFGRADGGEAA
jgi:excisionase family DNA binding protein